MSESILAVHTPRRGDGETILCVGFSMNDNGKWTRRVGRGFRPCTLLTFQVLRQVVVSGLFGYLLSGSVVFVDGQERRAGRHQQVANLPFAVLDGHVQRGLPPEKQTNRTVSKRNIARRLAYTFHGSIINRNTHNAIMYAE